MHALRVGHDVLSVIDEQGINYGEDLSKKFVDLLTQGAFNTLLIAIQKELNNDPQLSLLTKLNVSALKLDPNTGQTFAEHLYNKSIVELIEALDGVLSHSPYRMR